MTDHAIVEKISERLGLDSVGQLIATDVIIARDGKQSYMRSELPGYNPDTMENEKVDIDRPWEEVKKSAPTYEGKPFVVIHPQDDVHVSLNYAEVTKGIVKDVRPGTEKVDGYNVLLATLVINNPDTIDMIREQGWREVSAGYDCDIDMEKLVMTDMVGNHVALVESGRADIARIRDHQTVVFMEDKELTSGEELVEDLANISNIDKDKFLLFEDDEKPHILVLKLLTEGKFNAIRRYAQKSNLKVYGVFNSGKHNTFIIKDRDMHLMMMKYMPELHEHKTKRNAMIVLPGNESVEFDTSTELDELLHKNQFEGIIEFQFEGQVIDEYDYLPKQYQEILNKHGFVLSDD